MIYDKGHWLFNTKLFLISNFYSLGKEKPLERAEVKVEGRDEEMAVMKPGLNLLWIILLFFQFTILDPEKNDYADLEA